jgi:phosphoribosylanthranilate isomerase
MDLFRVKICGITRPEDAIAVAEAGGDAIGLNFYAKSPRFVQDDLARQIIAALPPPVAKVGVFVNSPAAEIREKAERLKLDWVQLHGDEPPEFVLELPGLRVIRAVRMSDRVTVVLPKKGQLVKRPSAVLIDAYDSAAYGGTGKTIPWDAVPEASRRLAGLPVILAGGLTPENVAEAIATARPHGVDTASGVESSPGIKDPEKLGAFIRAARESFSQLGEA